VGLRNYFDGKYFSCDMHTTKDKPDFYKKVLHKMRLSSNEVVFFDDEEKNVETAKDVGITAYLYKSSKQFEGLILNR
jgi:HAD superfamily hydrolase (TIGR01509 family)